MGKIIFTFLCCCAASLVCKAQPGLVIVKGHQFILDGKKYHYIGANYWYGGLLATTEAGKIRLKKELDFLASKGVNNLRVLAVAEGEGIITAVERVQPAYQPAKGIFRDSILIALDYLLAEMGKRQMKAVLFLSNNWEWSGGFLQYLNWNGQIADSVLARKIDWEDYRDYVSRFYSCGRCIEQQRAVVKRIVSRTNTITGKAYAADPAIMSWELANEPRPMRPAAVPAYKSWIAANAALIKSLDRNHLVTTGAEGDIGTEGMENYLSIHRDKNIDYATIHIWPKNWSWFADTSISRSMDSIITKTTEYIDRHRGAMQRLGKPLVIEEFGLPRDQQRFTLTSTTHSRDYYYSRIFSILVKDIAASGVINGANFWAFGGMGRPSYRQHLWAKGEDLLGDPPMEEQGLNSVFNTDHSTWKLIFKFTQQINHKNRLP
ncbi:MAG: endo-beta-mannanase [Ferruginibacter sp.]|nr:endo-beta-mannanase [Ferruginibacter sp.]